MTFNEMGLCPEILQSISEQKYTQPTEIQSKAIPLLLKHPGDFVGQAQTGTGKTAAFLIPLLEKIKPEKKKVQALILSPTRELANQIHNEFKKISKHLPISSQTIYGGTSYRTQIQALRQNHQVIIGTPGRTIDLINKRHIDLSECTQLIIDEADEMLNMGFLEDVQTIIKCLNENKRSWLFSATIPKPIDLLIKKHFSQPEFIRIEKKTLSNDDVDQYYCPLSRKDFSKALRLIGASAKSTYGIVFCETRLETNKVAEELANSGLSALPLNGDLNQEQRDYALAQFKSKRIQFLVCTDVASRGIDVSHVTHVFNFGLPRQKESYVHRIGRTGRAGRSGTAISFVSESDGYKVKSIENLTGKKMKIYKLPSVEEVKKNIILFALEKISATKSALKERGQDFLIDPSFQDFKSYFEDCDSEETLKILFTHLFKRELSQIESQFTIKQISLDSPKRKSANSRRRKQPQEPRKRSERHFKKAGTTKRKPRRRTR